MERLLVLTLSSQGCSAEAVLNGIPVAATPASGGHCCLPVHEFTLTGKNRIELVYGCPIPGQAREPQPRTATGPVWARAKLLLVRMGRSPVDETARQLADVGWSAPTDKSFEVPGVLAREVELPVNFPRWKWLEAPAMTLNATSRRQILEFLQQLALDLGRGHPDNLIAAARLRFDELALAYQLTPAEAVQRFRDQLQRLFTAKALTVVSPLAEESVLRPILDDRLIECLTPLGGPLLRTQNANPALGNVAWPMRLALVEGRIYVLR